MPAVCCAMRPIAGCRLRLAGWMSLIFGGVPPSLRPLLPRIQTISAASGELGSDVDVDEAPRLGRVAAGRAGQWHAPRPRCRGGPAADLPDRIRIPDSCAGGVRRSAVPRDAGAVSALPGDTYRAGAGFVARDRRGRLAGARGVGRGQGQGWLPMWCRPQRPGRLSRWLS